MNDLRINFNENKEVWNLFVTNSSQCNIFSNSNFLDSLNIKYDLATCYFKDNIVCGAPILYDFDGSVRNKQFPFTQYHGLLLAESGYKKSHSQITNEYKITNFFIAEIVAKYKKICLSNSWHLNDLRPFQWFNYNNPEKGMFQIDLRYTGVLKLNKLNSLNDLLSEIRTVRRQEFNKSSISLSFKFGDDVEILDDLHKKTFERQNIKRTFTDGALLKSISRRALDLGYGKIGFAYLKNEPVSAALFLYDKNSAYYLFGANHPDYRSLGSGTFVMVNMINDAIINSFSQVDFCGVNSPNRGDFKISFNAEIKPYFICSFK